MSQNDNTKRKYNAEETRMRLVTAAKHAFTHAKFEDVSVRELAATADANVALVNRYFGSKQGLFEAVFEDLPQDDPLQTLPLSAWPSTLAAMMVGKIGTQVDFDPLLALLRSSQSAVVGEHVRDLIENRLMAQMAKLLPGDALRIARTRALLAFILGVDVTERMLKLPFDPELHHGLKPIYERVIASILLDK